MTEKQYISSGTLADHFEHWRHRLGSDREASRQVQRSVNNEWLVCDRPLSADFKLTRIAGKIMVETREGISDAADYRVGRLSDPGSLEADKLTPSQQAMIDAMFPDKPSIETEAKAPSPPKRRGRPWSPIWLETVIPVIDPIVEKGRPYATLDATVDAVLSLMGKKDELKPRTIERWITRNRPGWVAAKKTGT